MRPRKIEIEREREREREHHHKISYRMDQSLGHHSFSFQGSDSESVARAYQVV